MKVIIFDAGTLINFSMNGMLDIIKKLKSNVDVKFIITKEVEYEIVKKPLTIKKYKLGAIRLRSLIDEKILEFPESLGINSSVINERERKFLSSANSVFYVGNKPLHLIDLGEASCIALSSILTEKRIENIIAIDERTTRMLFEKPENLKKLLDEKLHMNVTIKSMPNIFGNFRFIRSSELVYVAYKKGISKIDKEMLDAMLYGTKFKGCAISSDEIREIERIAI